MEIATIAEFDAEQDAITAAAALRDAEIPYKIDHVGGRFEIRVPQEFAYYSTQLVTHEHERPARSAAGSRPCPECGHFETEELKPYAFIVLIIVVALALVLFALGYSTAALLIFIVGWIAAQSLSRLTGKHRCSSCGWVFSSEPPNPPSSSGAA